MEKSLNVKFTSVLYLLFSDLNDYLPFLVSSVYLKYLEELSYPLGATFT